MKSSTDMKLEASGSAHIRSTSQDDGEELETQDHDQDSKKPAQTHDAALILAGELFHPDKGITLREKTMGLKKWQNCFQAKDAVLWIKLNKLTTEAEAIRLGRMLQKTGYIVHRKGYLFDNSKHWYIARTEKLMERQGQGIAGNLIANTEPPSRMRHRDRRRERKAQRNLEKSTNKIVGGDMIKGAGGGGAAGAGIGAAIGLVGGPVGVAVGAVVGAGVGFVVGAGSGAAAGASKVRNKNRLLAKEIDDIPLYEAITDEDQLAYFQQLIEHEKRAQESAQGSDSAYLFPPQRPPASDHEKQKILEGGMLILKVLKPESISLKDVSDSLFNFRDLSSVTQQSWSQTQDIVLFPGKIHRTACLGRGIPADQEGNPESAARTISFLRDTVKIKTMIDLRNQNERAADPVDWVVEEVYPTISYDEFEDRNALPKRKRFNLPLFTTGLKLKGMFWEGSDTNTKLSLVGNVFKGTDKAQNYFAEQAMNPMGLLGLNKLILAHAPEQIVKVLRVCADEENYPLVFHCSSGKDRTGFVAAMILSICGVEREDIVEDYHLSEKMLEPVMHLIAKEDRAKGLSEEFDGTPRRVMEGTLDFIHEYWGSVPEYLATIGFGFNQQERLRRNLMEAGFVPRPAGDLLPLSQQERKLAKKQFKTSLSASRKRNYQS